MKRAIRLKTLLVACLLASLTLANDDELLSLSLKELLAIPVDRPYQGAGIFQSERHKISKNSVNVGLLVPLTSWPRYSAQLIAAADLAVEHVNNNGGIAGKPLAVIRADTDNTVTQSYEFAKQLVGLHKSQAIIGPVASDEAAQILRNVNDRHKVPMFSYASSANILSQLTQEGYFWRLVASNEQQVARLAEELSTIQNLDKVYIVGSSDIYSREIVKGITQRLPSVKFKQWTFSSKIDPSLFDIEAESEAIQAFNPQAILLLTKARLSDTILTKLINNWEGKFPLVFTGDNFQFYDLSNELANNASLCVKTLISRKNIDAKFKYQLESLIQSNITDLDAAYVFDSIMLYAMAKQLEQAFNIPHSKAIRQLTEHGHSITYNDYANITSLYRRHKNLTYNGVSGPVRFDHLGNNIFAGLNIQKSGLGCL